MLKVSFRFYGQLNDFLPAGRRGRAFTHLVTARSSVKDAIEGLGVPHPEVDIVLVNGIAEDFAYHPRPADRVSVFPAFRSIDITGLRRAGSDPPEPTRFAVDVHLGKLAARLRLAGFDTVRLDDDAELARTAARDGRVLLTRDLGVLKRSIVQHGYWIRYADPEWQLVEILERYVLLPRMQPFTRCLRCNTPLVPADAAVVASQVPPRARATFRDFRRCPGCARVYWKGSHHQQLAGFLDRACTRASVRTRAS